MTLLRNGRFSRNRGSPLETLLTRVCSASESPTFTPKNGDHLIIGPFFSGSAPAGALRVRAPGALHPIWAPVGPLSIVKKKGFSLNGPKWSPWQGPDAHQGPYPLSRFQTKKRVEIYWELWQKMVFGLWWW